MNSTFEQMGKDIGAFTDEKQKAYGNSVDKAFELMKVFLSKYRNPDLSYTIPESLLQHLLLQVRIIDKQNRIFSNPEGDLMGESPYGDITGYGMIGKKMDDEKKAMEDHQEHI